MPSATDRRTVGTAGGELVVQPRKPSVAADETATCRGRRGQPRLEPARPSVELGTDGQLGVERRRAATSTSSSEARSGVVRQQHERIAESLSRLRHGQVHVAAQHQQDQAEPPTRTHSFPLRMRRFSRHFRPVRQPAHKNQGDVIFCVDFYFFSSVRFTNEIMSQSLC